MSKTPTASVMFVAANCVRETSSRRSSRRSSCSLVFIHPSLLEVLGFKRGQEIMVFSGDREAAERMRQEFDPVALVARATRARIGTIPDNDPDDRVVQVRGKLAARVRDLPIVVVGRSSRQAFIGLSRGRPVATGK